MILAQYIDRFGAQSVLGRQMTAKELIRITAIENVVTAYRSRAKSLNWVTWASENPRMASILREIETNG